MSLTLHNATGHRVQFHIRLGDIHVAWTHPLEPQETRTLPLEEGYQISAMGHHHGHIVGSDSIPLGLQSHVRAKLQVTEHPDYPQLGLSASSGGKGQLLLEHDLDGPVVFHIGRGHAGGNNVLVPPGKPLALQLDNALSVHTIVGGITLDPVNVHPFATITVVDTQPERKRGFFRLVIG